MRRGERHGRARVLRDEAKIKTIQVSIENVSLREAMCYGVSRVSLGVVRRRLRHPRASTTRLALASHAPLAVVTVVILWLEDCSSERAGPWEIGAYALT
jgi:hypothetical protein